MEFNKDEPVFAIRIVAQKVGVHQQTLRNYERWGLISPTRSNGGTRCYSHRDLEKIRKIREWMATMGVNRAGIEVMLRLMRRIDELEQRLSRAEALLARRAGGDVAADG